MIQEVKATDSRKRQTASLEQSADTQLPLQLCHQGKMGSRRQGDVSQHLRTPNLFTPGAGCLATPATLRFLRGS